MSQTPEYLIINDDCVNVMKDISENYFDSIVCDP
jgi:DNA modification methylase